MNYFDFMESIDKLSKKVDFSRDDMLDIIDYISLKIGFSMDTFDYLDNGRDYLISSVELKSIFDDLMIRFGPRSSDE